MTLQVKGLRYTYPRQEALQDVSFEVEKGSLLFLLGENGAGKTTLFRCMLGFLKQYAGDIFIDGKNAASLPPKELAKLVAYIPQAHSPTFNYTVLDTVLMGTNPFLQGAAGPGEKEQERAVCAMEKLGISHMAKRGFAEISGGERQLVLIARALAQNTKILVMDEPTANLDYGNQYRVLELVRQLAGEGYLILFSSHNPEHALLYATHVLALQKGKRLAFGPPETALTPEILEQLYGIPVQVTKLQNGKREVPVCLPVL